MNAPRVDVVGLLERLEKALPPLFEVAVIARALPLSDASDAIAVCKNARAAVAELIEAAHKLRADVFLWRLTGNMPDLHMLAAGEEALDAALANIGPHS